MSLAFVYAMAAPGVALAAPVELDWDAPDACPDRDDVEELVSRHLGERATARAPVSASGRVVQTPNGYALTLRTATGERRIEAVSCEELAQSAAVILALLIDPQAAPPEPVVQEPEPAPNAEPPAVSEPEEEPEEPRTATYAGLGSVRGFVRIEALGDVGLLPKLAIGPGLAGGLIWERLTIELAGMYLPPQDLIAEDVHDEPVVGDLRVFGGRLGACYALTVRTEFGPCLAVEYARLVSRADRGRVKTDARDEERGLWSLLLAARLWVPFGSVGGVVFELGLGLPMGGADVRVDKEDGMASLVHQTSGVMGRARVGFELRF